MVVNLILKVDFVLMLRSISNILAHLILFLLWLCQKRIQHTKGKHIKEKQIYLYLQWDLVCDKKWWQAASASMFAFGMFAALLIHGTLADL